MKSNMALLMVINMILLAELQALWSENDIISIIHALSVAGCLCPQHQQYQHLGSLSLLLVLSISGCGMEECIGNDLDKNVLTLLTLIKNC